jgi:methyltransferase (TIGR00027 family)
MKENQASFTALMVAYMRAYHAMHETPKIFDDFLAYNLIPKDKLEQIEQYLTWDRQLCDTERMESCSNQTTTSTSIMPAFNKSKEEHKWTAQLFCRARYAEETLEKSVSQGVRQYVILGAGLDTFAFRRSDLMEKLEVFEVDHPATQKFKLHRLAELGWEHPKKLHFIPIDFTKESLLTVLINSSSYDPKAKSFFSWLGVTYFLTRDELFSTLRSITKVAPAGSIIVFDYFDNEMFIPDKSSPLKQKTLEFLQNIGEPMITGFDPSTLAEDLKRLGFGLQENLSPADIEKRYLQGRTDAYHAVGHVYFACAVVE